MLEVIIDRYHTSDPLFCSVENQKVINREAVDDGENAAVRDQILQGL